MRRSPRGLCRLAFAGARRAAGARGLSAVALINRKPSIASSDSTSVLGQVRPGDEVDSW